jgi:hypothetical protein
VSAKKEKEKVAASEEPEEWKRFKELARKVINAPPMPRELRKARPKEQEQKEAVSDAG